MTHERRRRVAPASFLTLRSSDQEQVTQPDGNAGWLTALPLKDESKRELRLERIANAHPEKAAEVKQGRRTQGVQVVGVIESIEDLDLGNNRPLGVVK